MSLFWLKWTSIASRKVGTVHSYVTSVADPDPGFGAFLTSGSGIRDE
jgi:hypothetical protein